MCPRVRAAPHRGSAVGDGGALRTRSTPSRRGWRIVARCWPAIKFPFCLRYQRNLPHREGGHRFTSAIYLMLYIIELAIFNSRSWSGEAQTFFRAISSRLLPFFLLHPARHPTPHSAPVQSGYWSIPPLRTRHFEDGHFILTQRKRTLSLNFSG